MKAAILFFLLLINIPTVRADWFQQNSGTTNYLNNIKFVSALTGYVGADGGFLLKTTNGGNNWNRIILGGDNYFLSAIFFFDVNNIIFGEYGGYIFRTNDGGITFDSIETNIYGMTSIFFPSIDTGYANSKYYGAFKTTNGGLNWFNVFPSVTELQGGIYFVNNQTGFVTGGTNMFTVLKTTNGGVNWEQQRPGASSYIFDIQFVNNTTGYCVGKSSSSFSGVICKTTDLGSTWILQDQTNAEFNSVSFIDENTGYVSSYYQCIAKTTNGGLNWAFNYNALFQGMTGMDFANAETGYAVSTTGKILKTTDGGAVGINQISNEVPEEYHLYQNFPNPFNPTTKINYELPVANFVKLKVYDILGKEIITLVNEKQSAGVYSVDFDGSNMLSGIYFYQLITDGYSDTKRMVLVK